MIVNCFCHLWPQRLEDSAGWCSLRAVLLFSPGSDQQTPPKWYFWYIHFNSIWIYIWPLVLSEMLSIQLWHETFSLLLCQHVVSVSAMVCMSTQLHAEISYHNLPFSDAMTSSRLHLLNERMSHCRVMHCVFVFSALKDKSMKNTDKRVVASAPSNLFSPLL